MKRLFNILLDVVDTMRDYKKIEKIVNDNYSAQFSLLYNVSLLLDDKLPKKQYEIAGEKVWAYICPDMLRANGVFYAMAYKLGDTRYIVIDDDMIRDFDEEEQNAIIAHEVGHIKDELERPAAISGRKALVDIQLLEYVADEYAAKTCGKEVTLRMLRKLVKLFEERDILFRTTKRYILKRIEMVEKNF